MAEAWVERNKPFLSTPLSVLLGKQYLEGVLDPCGHFAQGQTGPEESTSEACFERLGEVSPGKHLDTPPSTSIAAMLLLTSQKSHH